MLANKRRLGRGRGLRQEIIHLLPATITVLRCFSATINSVSPDTPLPRLRFHSISRGKPLAHDFYMAAIASASTAPLRTSFDSMFTPLIRVRAEKAIKGGVQTLKLRLCKLYWVFASITILRPFGFQRQRCQLRRVSQRVLATHALVNSLAWRLPNVMAMARHVVRILLKYTINITGLRTVLVGTSLYKHAMGRQRSRTRYIAREAARQRPTITISGTNSAKRPSSMLSLSARHFKTAYWRTDRRRRCRYC
ncbi:MAG: hypothetical protein GPOALKHO_001519 [Sodalis sp.]|nr:MAG: hypothetical protein GPOALKHO_001519 [Sodalis sp.]